MQKKHFQQKVKEYDEYNKHMDEQKKMTRKHNSEMHSIELQLNKQELVNFILTEAIQLTTSTSHLL